MANQTVIRYPIPVTGTFILDVPMGARELTVQVQYGVPCVWMLVSPDAPHVSRIYHVEGTDMPFNATARVYIGTFQADGGAFVFHLFGEEANRG